MNDDDRESGGRGSTFNGWWLASACVLLLALLGGAAIIGRNLVQSHSSEGSRPQPAAAPSTPTAPAAPTGAGNAAPATGCQRGSGKSEAPAAPPRDVSWLARPGGVIVPVSAQDGPTRRAADGVWSCFSHDGTGALLAAVNIAASLTGSSAARVYESQFVPGPARNALLEAARQTPAMPAAPGSIGQLCGFRVLSYSGDEAVVQVVAASNQRYAVSTIPLRWFGGDWKMNADVAGGLTPAQFPASLEGYIPWGAA